MIIIAKNITSFIIDVSDLGVILPANSSIILSDIDTLTMSDIQKSIELKENIEKGYIILNDGVLDLSLEQSLTFVGYVSPIVAGSGGGIHFNFGDKKVPYFECQTRTFILCSSFLFEGTTKAGNLTSLNVMAKKYGNAPPGILELRDFTNTTIIATVFLGISSDPPGTPSGRQTHLYTGEINNLPVEEALFELYIRNIVPQSRYKIYSISLT